MDRDVWGCVSVTSLREPMPSLRAGGECLCEREGVISHTDCGDLV